MSEAFEFPQENADPAVNGAPANERPDDAVSGCVSEPATARAEPARNVVVCRSCGQDNPPGTGRCLRPTCRKMLPGNRESMKTGLDLAKSADPTMVAIDNACRASFEQDVADAGGREQLIARVLADHENRWLLQGQIYKLAIALERHGMFDRRGRLRTAWLQRLDGMINTAASLDKMLGLQRRTKRVPDLRDYLEQRESAEEDA